jgi:hypothetical protein
MREVHTFPNRKTMSNNKQTSVEYLIKEFSEILGPISTKPMQNLLLMDAMKQAKSMHKNEIKDAVGVGSQFDRNYLYGYQDKAKQYYNETFEK